MCDNLRGNILSSNNINFFDYQISEEALEILCNIPELKIFGTSIIDIRRAAIKIARAKDIEKICSDLIMIDSKEYKYNKKITDFDLLFCALKQIEESNDSVVAMKIWHFYQHCKLPEQFKIQPPLHLNVDDLSNLSQEQILELQNIGIISTEIPLPVPDEINDLNNQHNNNEPINNNAPLQNNNAAGNNNNDQLQQNLENNYENNQQPNGVGKSPLYKNKYLWLGAFGIPIIGLIMFLIYKDFKEYVEKN